MPSRIVVDTSGAYYKLLGSKEMKEAFDSAVGDSKFYISTLIRMEWLRGVVLTLIDAYSVVKESDSVADALIVRLDSRRHDYLDRYAA